MFAALFRLLGYLVVLAVAGIGLLFQWADAHPVAAFFMIPSSIAAVMVAAFKASDRRKAARDLRMQDAHVPSMSPREYEQFVARQLERAGWKVLHCGRPGDQGCDVLAELRGFKAVVQCKLYRARVGNDAVQQVVATRRHYGAQVMVVVAPAGFTRSAEALAATNLVHLLRHDELHTLERAARIP